MELLLVIVIRWIHIGSAILAIGAPFFVCFALLPAAAKTLDDPTHQKLKAAINGRWSKVVYTLITLFILTGLFQFLVPIRGADGALLTARWKEFAPDDKKFYHMIFGFKMLAAFTIFFLASALAGRAQMFAPIRKNAKMFLAILLLLGGAVVGFSSTLRYYPHQPTVNAQASNSPTTTSRPAGTRPNRNRFRPGTRPTTRPTTRSDLP